MTQQEILQELRWHGGKLAVAAANEIETLAAQNTELDNSLSTLTQAYSCKSPFSKRNRRQ